MSASCIYAGSICHRRVSPAREFRHSLALAYLDLDELPALLDGRLVRRRAWPVRFRRSDYHGDARVPLAESVRATVQARTGARPRGAIRMLAQLSSFGHCFNPVSFYYCMCPHDEGVQALVAEVTNTPWGQRHAYVMQDRRDRADVRATVAKEMHVSPFMAMEQTYDICTTSPDRTLSVSIRSHRHGELVFAATLSLRRRELTRSSLRWLSLRYPLASLRVLALIYLHAAAIRVRGARAYPHPHPPRARR